MNKYLWFPVMIMLLCVIISNCSGLLGKTAKVPKKAYSVINISNGEFLHYGFYAKGEKQKDWYYVTEKITNEKGGIMYRVYSDMVTLERVKKGKALAKNYKDWPSFYLIDPAKGCLIESEMKYDVNDFKDNSDKEFRGMIYSHYQFYQDKGYVEFITKSENGDKTNESKYRLKVDSNFPYWDGSSTGFLSMRFMDINSPGYMYTIIPQAIKEPMPFTYRFISKETLSIKPGKFQINKLNVIMADPFIAKLMEPFLKNLAFLIEDSDRRLLVKFETPMGYDVLEDISNVIIK